MSNHSSAVWCLAIVNLLMMLICSWMITLSITVLRTKLFNIDNLSYHPFDFISRDVENKGDEKPRKAPPSVWFVGKE